MKTRTFSYSKSTRWIVIFGFFFFGGMTVLALLLPLIAPDDGIVWAAVVGVILFGGFTLAALSGFRVFTNSVTVSGDGITFLRRRKIPVFLGWKEIGEIRYRDSPWLLRMELIDHGGDRRMKFDYQLAAFEELDEMIWRFASLAKERSLNETSGRFAIGPRHWFRAHSVSVIFMLLIILLSGIQVGWVGLGVLLVHILFFTPYLLELHADRLIVRCRLRSRIFWFQDLEEVSLKYPSNWNPVVQIELRPRSTGTARIGNFTHGAANAFRAIRARWEAWKAENAAPHQ